MERDIQGRRLLSNHVSGVIASPQDLMSVGMHTTYILAGLIMALCWLEKTRKKEFTVKHHTDITPSLLIISHTPSLVTEYLTISVARF